MQKAALEYGAAFYKLCNNRAEARELLDTFCQFHGFTHIRTRRHGEKQVLCIIGNSESFDKRLQAFARDAFTARQFLQLLVRILNAITERQKSAASL